MKFVALRLCSGVVVWPPFHFFYILLLSSALCVICTFSFQVVFDWLLCCSIFVFVADFLWYEVCVCVLFCHTFNTGAARKSRPYEFECRLQFTLRKKCEKGTGEGHCVHICNPTAVLFSVFFAYQQQQIVIRFFFVVLNSAKKSSFFPPVLHNTRGRWTNISIVMANIWIHINTKWFFVSKKAFDISIMYNRESAFVRTKKYTDTWLINNMNRDIDTAQTHSFPGNARGNWIGFWRFDIRTWRSK